MKKDIKTIFIVSYYSEVDWSNQYNIGVDNNYQISYPAELDINDEIQKAYKELSDAEELTNMLSVILDYMIKKGLEIEYKIIDTVFFDCDYGYFQKKGYIA